jgi:hypothetical protein
VLKKKVDYIYYRIHKISVYMLLISTVYVPLWHIICKFIFISVCSLCIRRFLSRKNKCPVCNEVTKYRKISLDKISYLTLCRFSFEINESRLSDTRCCTFITTLWWWKNGATLNETFSAELLCHDVISLECERKHSNVASLNEWQI